MKNDKGGNGSHYVFGGGYPFRIVEWDLSGCRLDTRPESDAPC